LAELLGELGELVDELTESLGESGPV